MGKWYHGTSEYIAYLKSQTWRKIRRRIIKRDKGLCSICEAKATHVHHHNYDDATMQGKNDDALTSLCDHCHRAVEFDGEAQRYNLIEKRKVFDQRRRDHLTVVRSGLCLHVNVGTGGNWRRVTFTWENARLAAQFGSMVGEMWRLLYTLRPYLSWSTRFAMNRFTQESGIKLYLKGTKKLAAELRLLDSGAKGEMRYRPDRLDDPLPEFRRVLGRGGHKVPHYKIRIKSSGIT